MNTITEVVKQYVDNSLKWLDEHGFMQLPTKEMPEDMFDEARYNGGEYRPWKAPTSTVKDKDLDRLETRIGLLYPIYYRELLKYRHFYELNDSVNYITFFRHASDTWEHTLIDKYYNSWEPDVLIKRGYLIFGNYQDWGIMCFDTNNWNAKKRDCPIIMIDH